MKDFVRKEPLFSLCGLQCGLCPMHSSGCCPGCGGGEGNQACAIARCSLNHGGVQFCWECGEYPCLRYDRMDKYDSFVSHRWRKRDVQQAGRMGLEAFLAQIREKRGILDQLLAGYNDVRRKTLFHTAVYRLELEDLQRVMAELRDPDIQALPPKEKAAAAAEQLRAAADRCGIDLKLVKKPGGK